MPMAVKGMSPLKPLLSAIFPVASSLLKILKMRKKYKGKGEREEFTYLGREAYSRA
jgi:hypothetical protein